MDVYVKCLFFFVVLGFVGVGSFLGLWVGVGVCGVFGCLVFCVRFG